MKIKLICKKCHEEHSGNWSDKVAKELESKQLCHTCNYWQERVDKRDDPNSIRIDGVQYWLKPEEQRGFRGFDGREFNIIFDDGRELKTTNLWFNGDIPALFKSDIPDNAKWSPLVTWGEREHDITLRHDL